jgi:hypothetical protein
VTGGGDGLALLWAVPRACHRFTCEAACMSFLCPAALSVTSVPPSGAVALRVGTGSGLGALAKAPAGIKEEVAGIAALTNAVGQFAVVTSQVTHFLLRVVDSVPWLLSCKLSPCMMVFSRACCIAWTACLRVGTI